MTDRWGSEISDLIVDYDPETLERRSVAKRAVLERLEREGRRAPLRVVRSLREQDGFLDPVEVDGVLVRSHLELQRLHEEFRVGALVRTFLAPLIELFRQQTEERPIRLVDIGCGLGYVARWLSAEGDLGDDVEITGADYNRALVGAATKLAEEDGLRCRFVAANAFHLSPPAHIYFSTGVLHHFRGSDLVRFFAEHERAGAVGFVHLDIRPSLIAPVGSWIFHQARMREPLAKWDGYWSAVRAHESATLLRAMAEGAPGLARATIDADPGIHAVVRIFQAVVGVRNERGAELHRAYRALGRRFQVAP